ncbi:MAG: hypothetical protein R2778_12175 [Saprospiraceae bacterium]
MFNAIRILKFGDDYFQGALMVLDKVYCMIIDLNSGLGNYSFNG